MFNLTKLELLWDWVGDLKKRIIPLEEKIPKDYSTMETATGQKWIDGKEIYSIVWQGNTPDSETSYISMNLAYDKIIEFDGTVYSGMYKDFNSFIEITSVSAKNSLHINKASSASYQNVPFAVIIYYTKPDPTPGRAPEDEPEEVKEPETKKNTRKKTTK